ncbi:MAG: 4Fe-4S binding protein [Chitinivibrionia bacterium]|nr:4Fe-4S binding protein [Chitinivibrionia bacterium]
MRHDTWAYIGRTASQLLFLGLTVWIGSQMIRGVSGATIEKYCPFGGVETLIPWLNKTGTICALSTTNISILAGVLIITLLFKRVFCSHICPVGAVSEWIAVLRRRLPFKTGRVPRQYHRPLTWLKYPLLAAIIYFTVRTQELIFRELDPYYVLFTLGTAHGISDGLIGIGAFSLWIIMTLLLLGFVVPLLFCKYLCPLAACLAPVSRLGLVRISRNEETCTSCGECDAACEWGVSVSDVKTVTSVECSNCQDCIRACSEPGTLTLQMGRAKS